MALKWDPAKGEWVDDAADPMAAFAESSAPAVTGVETQTATLEDPNNPYVRDPSTGQRLVQEVASALSYPIHSPMGFVTGAANEVSGIAAGVASLGGVAENPVSRYLNKEIEPGGGWREGFTRQTGNEIFDPETQHLGAQPGIRVIPFAKTAGDVMTPEGREHLKEHPSQVVLDALALLGGGKKPQGRLAPLTEKAATGVEKAAGALASKGGAEAVTKVAENRAVQYLTEGLPTQRSPEIAAFPTAVRKAGKEANAHLEGLKKTVEEVKPLPLEIEQLKTDLAKGQGSSNPRLQPLYDSIEDWSVRTRQEKLERTIPEEILPMIRDQVESRFVPKLGQGFAAELKAQGMLPELAEAEGRKMAAQMAEAVRKGEPNPFPERTKSWRLLNRGYDYAVKKANSTGRLYEHNTPVGPQVFSYEQHRRLTAAEKQFERGKLSQEDLNKVYAENVPGAYRSLPGLQELERFKADQKARTATQEGFGPAAARDAIAEHSGGIEKTWMDFANEGWHPVYVPSRALKTPIDEVSAARGELSTLRPGSLRENTGKSLLREDNPLVMIPQDEAQLASQYQTQKAIGQVYQRAGGKTYEAALQEYIDRGFSETQAHRMVKARRRGLNPSLDGKTKTPAPGDLTIPRDVAKSMEYYFGKQMPSMIDKAFGAWMVPVLWMSTEFHKNNILGGALLTSLEAGSPLPLATYAKEAWGMARHSGRGLDARIPHGAVGAPIFDMKHFRPEDLVKLQEGTRLAKLWQAVRKKNPVALSRDFGEFADSFFRAVTQLNEYDRSIRKKLDPWTARENAIAAASNVLQNWDSFSPIERQVLQRIMPFIGFRKLVAKKLGTLPMDHPFMTHFLYSLSRDQEEMLDLPSEWEHLVAISEKDPSGKQYWLSTRGMDPFADVSDLMALRGFLGGLHPFHSTLLEAISAPGFTYRGGASAFPSKGTMGTDPYTGSNIQKPEGLSALWGLVPQIDAISRWAGINDIPPPSEATPEGWLHWLDTYGTLLRVSPGVSYRSMEDAREKLERSLKREESFNKPKEPAMAGGGSLKWNPQTQTWGPG